jgi:hypothetical protein
MTDIKELTLIARAAVGIFLLVIGCTLGLIEDVGWLFLAMAGLYIFLSSLDRLK